jgi:hypothetical protein
VYAVAGGCSRAKLHTLPDNIAEAEHITRENSIRVNLENLSFVLKINVGLVHSLVHKDMGSIECAHIWIPH